MKKRTSGRGHDEFMAAAIGDLEWLKQSLRNKDSYTDFDENGIAAIHLCATHGRFECLRYLIEELKVDVNLPSQHGWRPLHLCINKRIGKRSLPTLLYLMHCGALLSIQNEDGVSPVHQAASEGHLECLKQLIEAGADFSLEDKKKNKPIDLAKLWGHKECAKLLATYEWHKDKKNVAKEKYEIKKAEIRQILEKIEQNMNVKKENCYLGGKEFSEWLEDEVERKKLKSIEEEQRKKEERMKREKNLEKYYEEMKRRKPRKESTVCITDKPFITTVTPTECFHSYPGNLKDVFPRHPLTLQPYPWSKPAELNPTTMSDIGKLLTENSTLIRKAAKERRAKSNIGENREKEKCSKENNYKGDSKNNKTLEDKMIGQFREMNSKMYYRSKTVLDLPRKKQVLSAESFKVDDAAFCFTNDVRSDLFKTALKSDVNDASRTGSVASTSLSHYMDESSHDSSTYCACTS